MKAIVILLVLGLATAAFGLKCKTCVNCEEIKSDTKSAECTKENSVIPGTETASSRKSNSRAGESEEKPTYKCYKATVAVGDGFIVERGCTTLKECKTDEKTRPSCDLCDTDNCNFAPGMKSWALGSIVLIGIIKMLF